MSSASRAPAQQQQWPRGPWNSLHDAAYIGSAEQAQAILSRGLVNINQGNMDGWTPLICAAFKGSAPVVKILLAAGANVSVATDEGCTALHVSAQEGHLVIVNMLLTAGADLETPNFEGCTPLHFASKRVKLGVMGTLIRAGASVDARTTIGQTPLYSASRNGRVDVVKVLLRAKADPSLRFVDTATGEAFPPLEAAAEHGHLSVVSELISQVGIEGCGGMDAGTYALQVAAREQHVEVMRVLMDAGVVDAGMALNIAARFGREASVKFLLQQQHMENAGGQVSYASNTLSPLGTSPLLESVEICSPRIARLLVDAGVNTTSALQATHPKSNGRVVFHGTPLDLTELLLHHKYTCGQAATEDQLHRLTAIRRLLMRVDAVHAASFLWPPLAVPFAVRAGAAAPAPAPAPPAAGERRPTSSSNPLTTMLPVLRDRARRRGVLLAAQWRYARKL